ncbi:MAG: YgiQ family radical SAM protein [Planctomycetota bacterium]|jgi:uncharacterized radical SAM protein YgiQ
MKTNAQTAPCAPAGLTQLRVEGLPVDSARPDRVQPLPITAREMKDRGWDEVDVVFVTGDAYIDHPSFAMAILGRTLEACGFRVAILPQPDWHSCQPWREFGKPRLFYAISAGNMDSMINHYTANRKVRNDDAYSPGGKIGLRPDRATLPYCHRAREAYKGVPIIAGGVEASLRRLAHYDYWSDNVRRSILLDAKADLVAYGMGESAIVEIARRLDRGETVRDLRNMRGVAYCLGASEEPPTGESVIELPAFEDVKNDKRQFAVATRRIHLETNPYNARTLTQKHDRQTVVCNPPRLPETEKAMDLYYDLTYTRKPHPGYREAIPAYQVVKDSVTIMRGCFGGCTYCSITTHQGRIIQSRSRESIAREVKQMGESDDFHGVISDLGGPTANMYKMRCGDPKIESICRRLSCVHPKLCPLLETDHGPLIQIMKDARESEGIRKVLIASGVRMDLAQLSPEYMDELVTHHVGGHLKVAPENTDHKTLDLMKRPGLDNFQSFAQRFRQTSNKAGKEQYLVPYFISAHPGNTLEAMIELAVFLKQNGYRPDQVQDFIPAPFDIAACMYHTGIDPLTMKEVFVAKFLRDRKLQRALMQFFKPENYFTVRKALLQADRADLIGDGCDALIPTNPPREAIEARREMANRHAVSEDHYHATSRMPGATAQRGKQQRNAGTRGYRPGRKGRKKHPRSRND